MGLTDPANVTALILVNGATLLSVLVLGFKVTRQFGRIEQRFDLMWADYERRLNGVRKEQQ